MIDALINFVEHLGREVVPIIGTPGSGKTYFLASLTKWVLRNIRQPEKVFLEGRKYLFDLAVRYSTVELDATTRCVKVGAIAPNVPTGSSDDLHKVLLRLPESGEIGIPHSFDLFTVDGPGEILINRPEILSEIVKRLRGLILLIDIVGDDPTSTTIDWRKVSENAIQSVDGLAEVVEDQLEDATPIALVVTKWDRLLTLQGFATEDERRTKWNMISKRVQNIYLPLVKQHRSEVFFHSSIGGYATFDDALAAGEELFPFPLGIGRIISHCASDAETF